MALQCPVSLLGEEREKTFDQIRSASNETFAQIGPYFDALVQAMPGSIYRLEDDGEGRFFRCFVCLPACKEAFATCLPLISFDACSIRNDFKGIVLAACSVDGNGEIVQIKFALPAIEDAENCNNNDLFCSVVKCFIAFFASSTLSKTDVSATVSTSKDWYRTFYVFGTILYLRIGTVDQAN
jgi:hypothetical protein